MNSITITIKLLKQAKRAKLGKQRKAQKNIKAGKQKLNQNHIKQGHKKYTLEELSKRYKNEEKERKKKKELRVEYKPGFNFSIEGADSSLQTKTWQRQQLEDKSYQRVSSNCIRHS